jgi:uncharacterized protein (DUF1697 family)
MADLRDLVAELGGAGARTLLQSGNLVFHHARRRGVAVERLLEAALRERLTLETDVLVRTAVEWAALVAANPFPGAAAADPAHLLLMCLKDAPGRAQAAALQHAIPGRETARVVGRAAYLVYPDGIGTSKLTATVIEKALGARGTARNWNTVTKLAALAGD